MGNLCSCRRTRPRLNARDALELSPFEKWRHFGIFPVKLCLHMALVVLVTAQAYMINDHYAAYSRAVGRNFVNIFFPSDQATTTVADFSYQLFTIRDTLDDTKRILTTYFQLPEVSVDAVEVATPESEGGDCSDPGSCDLPLPVIRIHYHNRPPETYTIYNSSSPWPMQIGGDVDQAVKEGDLDTVRAFFDTVHDMTFSFVIKSRGWGGGLDRNREVCLLWGLVFKYDIRYGGRFDVGIQYRAEKNCSPLPVTDKYLVLCAFIGVIAAVYQLLLIKGVCRHIGIMAELRQQSKRYERRSSSLHKMVYPSDMPLFTTSSHLEKQPLLDSPVIGTSYLAVMHEEVSSLNNHGQRGGAAGDDLDSSRHNGSMMVVSNDWDKLTLTEKLAVFNIWSVVSTLGNLLAMVYTSGGLVHHTEVITNSTLRLAIGLSCLMYWFSLVQYLEFNPRYYVMILTLKTAVPRIGKFLIGILPCFVGYALLGLVLFGDQNDLFASLADTSSTLFCVVNGDSIMTVLTSVSYVPVLGELYICVYMMLFMYVCLMTCIAIVEEAFFSAADQAYCLFTGKNQLDMDGSGSADETGHSGHGWGGYGGLGDEEGGGSPMKLGSMRSLDEESDEPPPVRSNSLPARTTASVSPPPLSHGGASMTSLSSAGGAGGMTPTAAMRRPSGRSLPPKLRQLLNSISTDQPPPVTDVRREPASATSSRATSPHHGAAGGRSGGGHQRALSGQSLGQLSPTSPTASGLASSVFRRQTTPELVSQSSRESIGPCITPPPGDGQGAGGGAAGAVLYDARVVDQALMELQTALLSRLQAGEGGGGASSSPPREEGWGALGRAEEDRRDVLRAIGATRAKVFGGAVSLSSLIPPLPPLPQAPSLPSRRAQSDEVGGSAGRGEPRQGQGRPPST